MTDSASLDLQGAIVQALKGNSAVASLVGGRIYDAVPTNATKPYISYGGDDESMPEIEGGGCADVIQVYMQIDAWSVAVGQPEVKRIAGAVRLALNGAELTLESHVLVVEIRHVITRYLVEQDGLTKHAAITLSAQVQH